MSKPVALLLLGLFVLTPASARADAQEADRTVAAARAAARDNKNSEAADLFHKAIEQDPSRRNQWLREWADQLTYSGKAREAVPLFREALSSGTLSPQETQWARLGLALALAWSDQKEEALREYEALITQDPRDVWARLGRARVLSELHRLMPANEEYAAVLRLEPGNAEAQGGRAQVVRELIGVADQMLHSDQAKEAVPLFREAVAAGTLSPEEARKARLGLAKALAWSEQHEASVREYDALLAQNGKDSEARRERAQVLSWMRRRREALSEYEAVLVQDPKDIWARLGHAEVLRDMGRRRSAQREYEAMLREDPGNRHARLGLATVLSWQDRQVSAMQEYETVLRQDPGNVDALRGLGRVQSWRGKQQDAQRRLRLFLRDHPGDPEAMVLLAQAQDGMGRPDRAKETLLDLLAKHPQDARGRQLLDEILRRQRVDGGLYAQSSEQSDHLAITGQTFFQSLKLHDGRTALGPRYQHWLYEPTRGGETITIQRPGIAGRHRLNDRAELNASLFLDMIQPEGSSKDRNVLTYDTYLTLWPSDTLRFDIGSNRTTFDNVKSLQRGISATYGGVSMDYVPDRMTRLTTRFNWGDYTDSNSRTWAQLEAERRVRRRWNLFLGARYTAMDFAKRLDNGYFNPKSYHSTVGTLRVWGHSGRRFYYDVDGSYGKEHAYPDGTKPYSSAGARLTYKIKERLEVQARYDYFSSKQASSGGFARRTTSIAVNFGL